MPKFGNTVDCQSNQIINVAAQVLASAPGTAVLGQFYYDSTAGTMKVCTNATGPVFVSFATGGATYAAPALTLGTANAAGAASTGIRSDASIAIFDATAPTASAVGDAAAVGAAAIAARRDHVHGREGFGNVVAQTTFGAASANGTALTEARADHAHGTPTHVNADHSAITLNSLAAPTAAVSMGSQNITNLLDPTTAQQAATKNYVDVVAQGLSLKASVIAATTAALPANTYANGASGSGATLTGNVNAALTAQDGQTLTAGQQLLVKNEAAAANNGIYVLTQVGSGVLPYILTRASDMDTAAKGYPGAFTFVEQGTVNASTGWVVSTTGVVTVGTTAINWTQFSGAGTYLAGTGLSLTGTTFSISATYVGQTSITTLGTVATGTWQGTAVAVGFGGTGQATAATARGTGGLGAQTAPTIGTGAVSIAAAGIPTKVTAVIGDGSTTSIILNHNLGTRDHITVVYRATTPWDVVIPDSQYTSANQDTLVFSVAPTASQYNVVMVG